MLWDSVCSCPPFSFHQLGGKHWWGHCYIASVGTSALYLSVTLTHIRWMNGSFGSVSYMWMKLKNKTISPREKLICTRLKSKLVMLLVAHEVRQNIRLLVECSALKIKQCSAVNVWCTTNGLSLKQEVLKGQYHIKMLVLLGGTQISVRTSYTCVQLSFKREKPTSTTKAFIL